MMNVANTIKDQLGHVTLAMLGANQLVGSDDALQFAIRGSRRVSKIRIVLDADDTYTVEFYRGRGLNIAKVADVAGVYVDGLHAIIAARTGLSARL